MEIDDVLESLHLLPPGTKVSITVPVEALSKALEHRAERPERVVTTSWCSENLGMSREWWAEACREGRIPRAFQDAPGGPWYLKFHHAKRHLTLYVADRTRARSRRRGPRRKA